jgi:hypothetical protein
MRQGRCVLAASIREGRFRDGAFTHDSFGTRTRCHACERAPVEWVVDSCVRHAIDRGRRQTTSPSGNRSPEMSVLLTGAWLLRRHNQYPLVRCESQHGVEHAKRLTHRTHTHMRTSYPTHAHALTATLALTHTNQQRRLEAVVQPARRTITTTATAWCATSHGAASTRATPAWTVARVGRGRYELCTLRRLKNVSRRRVRVTV